MPKPNPKADPWTKPYAMDQARIRAKEEQRALYVLRYRERWERSEFTASTSSSLSTSPTQCHGFYDPQGRWHPIELDDLYDVACYLEHTVIPAIQQDVDAARAAAPKLPTEDEIERACQEEPNKLAAWGMRKEWEQHNALYILGYQMGRLEAARNYLEQAKMERISY